MEGRVRTWEREAVVVKCEYDHDDQRSHSPEAEVSHPTDNTLDSPLASTCRSSCLPACPPTRTADLWQASGYHC